VNVPAAKMVAFVGSGGAWVFGARGIIEFGPYPNREAAIDACADWMAWTNRDHGVLRR
jgi:hypothetical protein